MPDAQKKTGPASPQVSHALLNPQQFHVLEKAAVALCAAHAVKVESAPEGAVSMDSEAFSDDEDDDEAGERNYDSKRTNKKKSKGGRIASEITREELSECFGMPSEEAARKLGVGLTVLKRICRKFGVPRWPYRKLKSLDRLITNVETGSPPGDTYKHLMKSADEIRQHQRAMCQGVSLDIDDKTKKLQQAYSKFNHKQRKATKDDDDEPSMLGDDSESQGGEGRNHFNLTEHQAVIGGGSDQGSDQMMYMSMPAGMAFPMPMMVMDSNGYGQQVASSVPIPGLTVADPPQETADVIAAQPTDKKIEAETLNLASEEANGVDEAAASVAANNASQMAAAAAANAAAWSQYTAAMGGHNPYEAWTQQQQPQQINGAQAPASTSEDPNATATTAAAAVSGYYMHPMMASYMPMASTGAAAAYPYSYMSAYMNGGYDPAAIQQYYQQYYQRASGMQGVDPNATASLAGQTVQGMVPVATDQMAGMMMDLNQASALALQQQQAAAHAAYYAHYAAAAAQQPQWAVQTAGVPQIFDMSGVTGAGQLGNNGVASGSVSKPETAKSEADGKRKRRPNVKYEGGDFMKGEEFPADAEQQLKDVPVDAVAHTLMHMSGGMDANASSMQQQQQQAMANGQYMSQIAAMQQGGMMMHPAWAQMMMPGAAAMQMQAVPVDMSGMGVQNQDASSMGMYAGMYAMMPQGYMAYSAQG